MPRPDIGLPERTAPRTGKHGCLVVAGLLFTFILGLVLCAIAARFLFFPTAFSVPRVQIQSPTSGTRINVSDPRLVLIRTFDEAVITRYELWVDGKLARYASPSDSSDLIASTFPASTNRAPLTLTEIIWRPETLGVHVLVARAFGTGGRVGTSTPVMVEAVNAPSIGLINLKAISKPDDTLQTIAQRFGVPPEVILQANPRLTESLTAGTEVVIPTSKIQLPTDYAGDDVSRQGDRPPVPNNPQTLVSPQGQGEGAARILPNLTLRTPWRLGFQLGGTTLPTPPADLSVNLAGGCNVRVRWSDNANSETGFRVYRHGAASGDFRPVAEFGSNQTFATLLFEDKVPFGGIYDYYISAFNGASESPGPIARANVPASDCQAGATFDGNRALLQFEAISLKTDGAYDKLYCYLSQALIGKPYIRIPFDDDSFLVSTTNEWDISEYASKLNRQSFYQAADAPVPVGMECWGWLGNELVSLGSVSKNHPRQDWDGRELRAAAFGVSENAFALLRSKEQNASERIAEFQTLKFEFRYRIRPFDNFPSADRVYDPNIPPPRILGTADVNFPETCLTYTGLAGGTELFQDEGFAGRFACAISPQHMLYWGWSMPDPSGLSGRQNINGYRIYVNREWNSERGRGPREAWDQLGESGSINQLWVIGTPGCDQTYAFEVDAFASGPPMRFSASSDPFILSGPPCAQPREAVIEVTLQSIDVGHTWESCFDIDFTCEDLNLEGYGSGTFRRIAEDGSVTNLATVRFWGTQADCVNFPCGFIRPRHTLDLATEDLRRCTIGGSCTEMGPGNNRFRFTLQNNDLLAFDFTLWDLDDDSGDDVWCGTTNDVDVFSTDNFARTKTVKIVQFSLEQWEGFTERSGSWDNDGLNYQDAKCTLNVGVRKIEVIRR